MRLGREVEREFGDGEERSGGKSAAPLPGDVPLSQMLPSSTIHLEAKEPLDPSSKGESSGLWQRASHWKLRASLKAREESVGEVNGEPNELKGVLAPKGGELM